MNTMRMLSSKRKEEDIRALLPEEYFDLKSKIHDRLLDLVDLSLLDKVEHSILNQELKVIVEKILCEDPNVMPLNADEKDKLLNEIIALRRTPPTTTI